MPYPSDRRFLSMRDMEDEKPYPLGVAHLMPRGDGLGSSVRAAISSASVMISPLLELDNDAGVGSVRDDDENDNDERGGTNARA